MIKKMFVANQPEGMGFDATQEYMEAIPAATICATHGATWDAESTTVSGPDAAIRAAFFALRKAITKAGHGDGCEDMPAPRLVAIDPGATGAHLQLQILDSVDNW